MELPPTLQERLRNEFERYDSRMFHHLMYMAEMMCRLSVKTQLESEVERLREELQNSHKTFEVYRDRARLSLKQTASDQKAADQTIRELTEKLKVNA